MTRNHPELKKTRVTIWLAAAFLCSGLLAAEPQRPNIIYVLADDWGLGDVKAYGGDRCQIDTPHMDRLAQKGMMFTDAPMTSRMPGTFVMV